MTNQVQNPNDINMLPRSFYERDTHVVAKELLGKVLVRSWRGKIVAGRIYEVESYVGENDQACHAAKGKTKRNEVMFGEAGHAYVYLIYGMHHCLNLVTERKDFPAAILIRGLVPVDGLALMKKRRECNDEKNLLSGPGKLTQALQITRQQNGEDVTTSDSLYVIDDGFIVPPTDIEAAERIGVDYAGEDAKLLWRYYIDPL